MRRGDDIADSLAWIFLGVGNRIAGKSKENTFKRLTQEADAWWKPVQDYYEAYGVYRAELKFTRCGYDMEERLGVIEAIKDAVPLDNPYASPEWSGVYPNYAYMKPPYTKDPYYSEHMRMLYIAAQGKILRLTGGAVSDEFGIQFRIPELKAAFLATLEHSGVPDLFWIELEPIERELLLDDMEMERYGGRTAAYRKIVEWRIDNGRYPSKHHRTVHSEAWRHEEEKRQYRLDHPDWKEPYYKYHPEKRPAPKE